MIKDPFTVGSDYADGSRYDTRDHKSDTFSYNGQTYEFKEIQSGDSETGKINGSNVDVTYVYKLPTQPTSPTQPTNQTDPTTPTKPTSPTQPTTPTSPISPTTPTAPTKPTSPTQPTSSTTPIIPAQPTTSVVPTQPTATQSTKLPQTANAPQRGFVALGLLALLGSLGLISRRRKNN